MAGGAESAGSSEKEIRKQLIENGVVDVIVAVGPKMFYTVALGCVLWFLDRGKSTTPRCDKVLFVDARSIYRQLNRAHRDWTPDQIRFIAETVRSYRGEKRADNWEPPWPEIALPEQLKSELRVAFNEGRHIDVPGFCKEVSVSEISREGHTLQPGAWVGVTPGEEVGDNEFKEQLEILNEQLAALISQARDLEQIIVSNVEEILET